jgi:hypothetical protein
LIAPAAVCNVSLILTSELVAVVVNEIPFGAVMTPLTLIAPLAVAVKLPFTVSVPKLIPVLSKIKFTLLTPAGNTGTNAVAEVFCKPILLISPLAVNTGVIAKLLAWVSNKTLEPAAVTVKVGVPVTVNGALSVIDPFAVTFKFPLIVELAKLNALPLVILTLLALVTPMLLNALLLEFKITLLVVPTLMVAPPATIKPPDCVKFPLLLIIRLPTGWFTPVRFKIPVLVKLISPLPAFVAPKLDNVLMPPNVVPPTEFVVKLPFKTLLVFSVMAPVLVKFNVPLSLPAIVMLPLLLILIAPVPVFVIAPKVNGVDVFVRLTSPLPVLLAL